MLLAPSPFPMVAARYPRSRSSVATMVRRNPGLYAREMRDRWVVLDAKGVIYRHGYDVEELLIPYVQRAGSSASPERVRALYLLASVGAISSSAFWEALGIASDDRDADYCSRYELTDGFHDFVAAIGPCRLACLTNDVSEWSQLARTQLCVGANFDAWLVSGELRCRKPAPEIYRLAADRLGADGADVLFVDDRAINLEEGRRRGWQVLHFGRDGQVGERVETFSELARIVTSWLDRRAASV